MQATRTTTYVGLLYLSTRFLAYPQIEVGFILCVGLDNPAEWFDAVAKMAMCTLYVYIYIDSPVEIYIYE